MMADPEDCACAPPVFEGDPDADEASSDFPWSDLLEGTGDFCTEQNAVSSMRWKQMSSTSKNGVTVTTFSRSLEEKGGLCEFLIRGTLPIARDVYFSCNADMEHRPEWDETCVSLDELSSSGPEPEQGAFVERRRILHWNVNYPWPLGKRDYVLEQTVLSGKSCDGKIFRATRGRTVDAEVGRRLRPSEKGITRIEDYRADLAVCCGATEEQTSFALLYFEDGKLNVPTWVLTKAAATTIPAQLAGFVQVASKYPKKRLQIMRQRFMASEEKGDKGEEADEEAFFSASDNEPSSPLNKKIGRTQVIPAPRSPAATAAAKMASPAAASASKAVAERQASAAKKNQKRVTNPQPSKDRKIASKLESALRLVLPDESANLKRFKDDSDDEDLEEGVLVVGKEERDLLLTLLAEARAKQSKLGWCSCFRRLCGHKRRHKQ